jgi:alpha-L-fucosidase
MSIRKGWFYHDHEEPHSLERLFSTYLNTVGGNACLNLNIPPNREGLFDSKDVERCKELGELIQNEFKKDISKDAVIEEIETSSPTQKCIDISFNEEKNIKYIVLKEDISKGQRVETFLICTSKDKIHSRYEGTTIGHKKICVINKKTDFLRIQIVAARNKVNLLPIEIY